MENMVTPAFWSGRKVLVTGHSGFKGSWLTLWLLKLGAQVEAISLANDQPSSHYHAVNLRRQITEHLLDIRERQALSDIIAQSDAEIVFHLAAQALVNASYLDPLTTFTSNVDGTLNLLNAVRSSKTIKTVIVITTDKVYANNDAPDNVFDEHDALGGNDPYSASKAMTELLCAAYRESFLRKQGIVLATARAGNVIGGGDWSADRLVPDYFRAVNQQQPFSVRYPDAVRPWQHVLESLRGYLLYAQYLTYHRDSSLTALNFGPDSRNTITVRDLLQRLSAFTEQAQVPATSAVAPQNREAINLSLNSAKAREALRWFPALDIDATLRFTSDWYQASRRGLDMAAFSLQQIADYESRVREQQENVS
ncbi:CDP-glucose 4,6-dehydratase [Erwinia tracheiphila]|uniref:CDP-glucose 4,6-dehydratase n=1 Tax=Erwinia tracheiphila TaxID=65700 RepID=UPI00033F5E58|nr:CDP-glucose 4,6-dehydratase [Erwinia tracheiphila]EOS93177.1 CDP-glucose 4,6-dehydratase [Erwinia tracheiphila PSU-1]UIA89921.1 CDP-glucose 4,6-dehydratase [Erwinia tracheiphila]UIA98224.1 CDP-glucose 4,6-dehydratase [Erwinia tracheiphila]